MYPACSFVPIKNLKVIYMRKHDILFIENISFYKKSFLLQRNIWADYANDLQNVIPTGRNPSLNLSLSYVLIKIVV